MRRTAATLALMLASCGVPALAQVQVPSPALAYQLRLHTLSDSVSVLARLRCQYGPAASRVGCVPADAIAVRDTLSPLLLVFSRWRLIDSLAAWKPAVDTIYDAPFARPQAVRTGPPATLGYNQRMLGVDRVCDTRQLCADSVTVGVMDCGFAPPADVAIRWGQTLDVFGDSATFEPVNAGDDHGDNVAGIAISSLFGVARHARGALIRVSVPATCGVFGYSMGRGLKVFQDSNVRIVTASIGGAPIDQAQIDAFTAWGGFFCAAAGNSGGTPVTQPAAQPGVLAITALGTDTTTTGYASWGPEIWSGAPGDAIVSDGPCPNLFQPGCPAGSSITQMSGTSMASPGCAGAIAIVLGVWPTIPRDTLLKYFQLAAIDRGPPGRDPHYGFGLMNPGGVVDSLIARGLVPTTDSVATVRCAPGTTCTATLAVYGGGPYDVIVDSPLITMRCDGHAMAASTPCLGQTVQITAVSPIGTPLTVPTFRLRRW